MRNLEQRKNKWFDAISSKGGDTEDEEDGMIGFFSRLDENAFKVGHVNGISPTSISD